MRMQLRALVREQRPHPVEFIHGGIRSSLLCPRAENTYDEGGIVQDTQSHSPSTRSQILTSTARSPVLHIITMVV